MAPHMNDTILNPTDVACMCMWNVLPMNHLPAVINRQKNWTHFIRSEQTNPINNLEMQCIIIMISVECTLAACELFIIQISGCLCIGLFIIEFLLLISAKLLKVNEK